MCKVGEVEPPSSTFRRPNRHCLVFLRMLSKIYCETSSGPGLSFFIFWNQASFLIGQAHITARKGGLVVQRLKGLAHLSPNKRDNDAHDKLTARIKLRACSAKLKIYLSRKVSLDFLEK